MSALQNGYRKTETVLVRTITALTGSTNIQRGQRLYFDDLPINGTIAAISVDIGDNQVVQGYPVLPAKRFPLLTVTFVAQDGEVLISNMPLTDLIATSTTKLRLFDMRIHVAKSYLTAQASMAALGSTAYVVPFLFYIA